MASDPSQQGQKKAVRVGKYEVVSHIATGGMGAVYRARDTENGRELAIYTDLMAPEEYARVKQLGDLALGVFPRETT